MKNPLINTFFGSDKRILYFQLFFIGRIVQKQIISEHSFPQSNTNWDNVIHTIIFRYAPAQAYQRSAFANTNVAFSPVWTTLFYYSP